MVKVELIGYTGKDSERHGNIVTFSVAAGARIAKTNVNGKYEYNTEWYDCISFDKNLSIDHGTKVKVTATLEYSFYNGKYKPRYLVESVTVTDISR